MLDARLERVRDESFEIKVERHEKMRECASEEHHSLISSPDLERMGGNGEEDTNRV